VIFIPLASAARECQKTPMGVRLFGWLAILYPFCASAQENKVVMTAEAYAELQAFAQENGYKSPEAAYRAFKKQDKETTTELRELETELQQVQARLVEEESHLAILELQNAAETSPDISLLILERINRAQGRIEQLRIKRDDLQKQIEQLASGGG